MTTITKFPKLKCPCVLCSSPYFKRLKTKKKQMKYLIKKFSQSKPWPLENSI